ncbi:MAG: hypothetical protein M1469_03525 [Bacteroidetes bacterium]|nr:hypothetical protein [Bacteroidota bacterium]
MPYLGEFIGHLLSELTNARVQADQETLRLAELYAGDQIMKNMPVPRFRLPNVTIRVPVAVKEVEAAAEGGVTKEQALDSIRQSAEKLLDAQSKISGIRILSGEKKTLKQSLDQAIQDFKTAEKVPLRITPLIERMVSNVVDVLRKSPEKAAALKPASMEKFANDLKSSMQREFTKFLVAPPRLNVLATTAELKEAGPIEILAQLEFTISEEGMEWSSIQQEGEVSKQFLIPE